LAQDAARSPPLRACALPIGPGSSEISFLMSDLERATPTSPPESRARRLAAWAANLCQALRDYFGSGGRRRLEPVRDAAALRRFLETRASYVAQTSLYGYLRTRAGQIYPQLFENDEFVKSVNIAKWHVWLAALSDLAVYAGGLMARRVPEAAPRAGALVRAQVEAILADTGTPPEADDEFAAHAQRLRARLAACDWTAVGDDESAFSTSPGAVTRWAPIVENLKELDEAIVRNSVRFRWQEVRRDLRACLDAEALLRAPADGSG